MKLLLLILTLLPLKAFSIELVLNGMTYHISNYAIHNNGQKIVIDHKGITNKQAKCRSTPTGQPANFRYVKGYRPDKKVVKRSPASKKKSSGGAFGRLLDELDAIRDSNSKKPVKRNYQ